MVARSGSEIAKDEAVYTLSPGAARCGYPQVAKGRNINVYISLLTLSGHLRTLAALPKVRPGFGRLMTQVFNNETHISAQQAKARPDARISRSHGHQSRAPRVEAPSRKRPCTVDAVTPAASVTTTSNNLRLTSSRSIRFKRENRLADGAAYGRVFHRAKRSRDNFFTVLCRRNEQNVARLGLAIAKKHCRHATARNRIKRLIRESFRQQQPRLAGLDVVVMNQPATARASNREIFDSLEGHWQRCREAGRNTRER